MVDTFGAKSFDFMKPLIECHDNNVWCTCTKIGKLAHYGKGNF